MRVLHLTRDFPPHVSGGISIAVGGMVTALRRAGHEVGVISFDAWRPNAAYGARRQRAAAPPPDDGRAVRQLVRVRHAEDLGAAEQLAVAFRPELLHVHHATLWPWAAGLRARLTVPAVKTVHVVQAVANELRGLTQETRSANHQRAVFAEADLVLLPSHAALDEVQRRYPDSAARLRLVPHGVDDSEQARLAAQHRWRAANALLYAGRFDDMKGTDTFFAALPTVLAKCPSVAVTVAGGLPANERSERRWLDQLRTVTAGSRRVRMAGWLPADELANAYARAAIVVVPSRFETFGLTALEAMLRGAAVIASGAGALRELIMDGQSGLIVPAGEAGAWADAIVSLVGDRERARRLGARAAAQIRQHYLWRDRLAPLLAAYGELI